MRAARTTDQLRARRVTTKRSSRSATEPIDKLPLAAACAAEDGNPVVLETPVFIEERPPTRLAVIHHRGHYSEIGRSFERLRRAGVRARAILLEPQGRGTAPALLPGIHPFDLLDLDRPVCGEVHHAPPSVAMQIST